MKHIYSAKAVATALFLTLSAAVSAQSLTTVVPSNKCEVVQDFNSVDGGFRSPSIFTESDYTEFHWDSAAGYWTETSGLAARNGSLISPVFINQQVSGGIDLGFYYKACTAGQYRIRIINVQCTCIGGYDVIATTANGPVWSNFPADSGRLCIRINDADLYEGQKFRVEISYRGVSPCDWIFDDLSLGGEEGAIILPVTFMGVNAKKEGSTVKVLWEVAEEVDVNGYEIERSTNGVNFTKAGYVTANGKPTYNFADYNAPEGILYYRIKNVDRDGRFKYSNIVKLNGRKTSTVVRAYPMPARNEVTVQHEKMNGGSITITTVDGRTVKQVAPAANAIQTKLDLNGMAPGMYVIRVDDGSGTPETIKLVKQ
jgi:hypothetical protein